MAIPNTATTHTYTQQHTYTAIVGNEHARTNRYNKFKNKKTRKTPHFTIIRELCTFVNAMHANSQMNNSQQN